MDGVGASSVVQPIFIITLLVACNVAAQRDTQRLITNPDAAKSFLQRHELESSFVCSRMMRASWEYQTNMTSENEKKMLDLQFQGSHFNRRKWREAGNYDWKALESSTLRRIFSFVTIAGISSLSEDKRKEYTDLLQEMKKIFSEGRICPYSRRSGKRISIFDQDEDEKESEEEDYFDPEALGCIPSLQLEPDLERLMRESRNSEELAYHWRAWRTKVGRPLRLRFLRIVQLSNEAARLDGFTDAGHMWRSDYESSTLEEDLEDVWEQVRPLYQQLHAYVRRKLKDFYGVEKFPKDGSIPAHLLGDMWAQNWRNILDLSLPYRNRSFPDVTQTMQSQGYSPARIFRTAEDFFISLGFQQLPIGFWTRSMLEKPRNREVDCHASAWDFCDGQDYRIKQCTEVTMNDLITAHHEMGHIYYSMEYKDLPLAFRDGANAGFHEAVGEALALSVSTPSHLQKIGLLPSFDIRYEDDINFLFSSALEKVAFLPYGYLVDQWRWSVYRGDVNENELNNEWWRMRGDFQGVSAPFRRTERDFDPGAKYHVASHTPYIRYFVGRILQFQIYEELCRQSNHRGPLHKCDIYRSPAAGRRLREVLELGKSKPWQEVLMELTGRRTNRLDATPLLRYYADLEHWLREQNSNDDIGWETTAERLTANLSSTGVYVGIILAVALALVCILSICICCMKRECCSSKQDHKEAE